MHFRQAITFLCFISLFGAATQAQTPFRVMSYNVENLFDPEDDPDTEDEEFLPSGARRWSYARYYHKLRQIARVISAAGEWDTPALVGLCEVENDSTLIHLLTRTQIRSQYYRYCMTHGPDPRGINMALLYQRDKFRYISHRSLPIEQALDKGHTPRHILHVWGEIVSGDTLDVLLCHFPSKYGGEMESHSRRIASARQLRHTCDSLSRLRLHPLLIAMGDFNDTPGSLCLREACGDALVNLFEDVPGQGFSGSQKYQGDWSQIDQILVHRRMLSPEASLQLTSGSVRTFTPDFLLINDKTWRGKRPFRSYHGYRYEAGFSDHLPVWGDFQLGR